MEITFYYAPNSSAAPVAAALHELNVPHRLVTFDLAKQEQKAPEFLKLNPNGKVPTIVVDGTPMFEALAILQWLGDQFGVEQQLWPARGTAERITAAAWTSWAYVSFCALTVELYLAKSDGPNPALRSEAWAQYALGELQNLLGMLDGHLAKSGFVVADRYSLADLTVGGMVLWGQMVGAATADHKHVSQWLKTVSSRPALKKEFGMA